MYLLGLTIVIGGQYFSWNAGLAAGFWNCFGAVMITGTGYLCLCTCLAEMVSALPFSGGAYGFVRMSVGPFLGFLAGCCESIQMILYVASSVIPLGEMLTSIFGTSVWIEPIWWIIFYITSLAINLFGASVFWRFNRFIGITSLALILLYIIISIPNARFTDYAINGNDVPQSEMKPVNFFEYLPQATWLFIGVEMIPLTSTDCRNRAREVLPGALVACIVTLFLTGIGVLFTSCSQYPGTAALSTELQPLNYGFSKVLKMSFNLSTVLSIPATYATAFGFMFAFGRQMSSMSASGLTFYKLSAKYSTSQVPYMALLAGSLLSFIVALSVWFLDTTFVNDLFKICAMGAYMVYTLILISYIVFAYKYSGIKRRFRNPVGVAAAVLGIVIFLLLLASVMGFSREHHYASIIFIFGYFFVMSFLYFSYVRKYQRFSAEEQTILFTGYVINGEYFRDAAWYHHAFPLTSMLILYCMVIYSKYQQSR